MKKLITGIVEFREKSLLEYRDKFSKLALGQNPDTLFVACCDSRVVPNVFASSDPGDLFVLRNIGNLIPPYHDATQSGPPIDISVAATIEFSLLTLNVSEIVVCGHSECGAMQFLLDKGSATDLPFMHSWLEFSMPSYHRFKMDHSNCTHGLKPQNALSRVNVLQQLDHLRTYPLVMERIEQGQLKIHGWWFDLATADVYHYDDKLREFYVIDAAEAERMRADYTPY